MYITCRPNIITEPGTYETRKGERVEIIALVGGIFCCHGTYSNGVADKWSKSGHIYFVTECDNDIIRKVAP
jgi:hypothetical protein